MMIQMRDIKKSEKREKKGRRLIKWDGRKSPSFFFFLFPSYFSLFSRFSGRSEMSEREREKKKVWLKEGRETVF